MAILFLNNAFLDSDQPAILANDRGFLLGDGIFETLKITAGSPRFLEKHWQRFIKGAAVLEIPMPINFETLEKSIDTLIEKNHLKNQDAIVRITLTRGVGQRGIGFPSDTKPNLLIAIFPFNSPEEKMLSAFVSSIRRNEHSPLAKIKSLNYLDNLLARREAEKAGSDEAILLNTAGNVCEADTANIFFVKNGILHTPRIEDGALTGITRDIILRLAQKEGIPSKILSFTDKELLRAQEVFLTNSVFGVKPVGKINGTLISKNKGPITDQLSRLHAVCEII